MSKIKRETSIEIIVGLFMVVVFIALSIFTIILSSEGILRKSYGYEFVFPEVGGLREGDGVFVRGMNVGRVKQANLEGDHVLVFVSLDVPIQLRQGYRIDVMGASMLGGKQLKIYEGPIGAAPLAEGTVVLGSQPIDMLEQLSEAVGGLQGMVNSAMAGEGTLGKLLTDETVYNNLVQTSEDLRSIVGRLENGENSLGMLLGADDGALYLDSKAVVANIRTITQNLADGKGALGKMISTEDTAYEDLQATLVALRSIAEGISAGEGTLGKLVRDEGLYDETKKMIEDVRAGVDDFRELSPVTSFGSVLFGAF